MDRVLLIEDDAPVRQVFRRVLESGGYEVEEAENGKVGVERFQDRPADLVLLDIFMPEQEGLETIIALRRIHPGVKILAVSGGGEMYAMDVLEIASQLGADRAVAKPIGSELLLSTVRELLGSAPAAP